VYSAQQVEAFSRLPSRLELISMLMSVMNGPARNLAAALNDVPARVVRTVKAIADQKGGAA
jgi:large subunit ribosomal protein L10